MAAAASLRIVHVNVVYDPSARSSAALLDRYTTLTGWATAVAGDGTTAAVAVVQRFSDDAIVERAGITYHLVSDGDVAFPPPAWSSAALIDTVARLAPDIVHVNGLMFPALYADLRRVLGSSAAIVAQDHAGGGPPKLIRLRPAVQRLWRAGFESLDAVSFTHGEMAQQWRSAGLVGERPRVLDIVEASTTLEPVPRERAAAETGVTGNPAIVWVGRLDANKDPLTVVDAMAHILATRPDARLWMLYQEAGLEADVKARLTRSPSLEERVALVGNVPHGGVAAYLSAADIFVSGSRAEGSGYALIEAMACGAVPVVTDILPFAAICGSSGARWPAGNAIACAEAVQRILQRPLGPQRADARARFAAVLSWTALGARTRRLYAELAALRPEPLR